MARHHLGFTALTVKNRPDRELPSRPETARLRTLGAYTQNTFVLLDTVALYPGRRSRGILVTSKTDGQSHVHLD
jgi:hypothetical protein